MCLRAVVFCLTIATVSSLSPATFAEENPGTGTGTTLLPNELGGVGPILPYGNDALGGTTSANFGTSTAARNTASARRPLRRANALATPVSINLGGPHIWLGMPSPVTKTPVKGR